MMSSITPSPDLFTILLPMKPAISPNTTHAKIDIDFSPFFAGPRARLGHAPNTRNRAHPGRRRVWSLSSEACRPVGISLHVDGKSEPPPFAAQGKQKAVATPASRGAMVSDETRGSKRDP